MKKAIIFDLDGTLWDTTLQVEKVWNDIAKNYNIDIKNNQIKYIMGLTKSEIIQHFFDDNIQFGEEFITECQRKENEYLSKYGSNIYKNTGKIKNLI